MLHRPINTTHLENSSEPNANVKSNHRQGIVCAPCIFVLFDSQQRVFNRLEAQRIESIREKSDRSCVHQ